MCVAKKMSSTMRSASMAGVDSARNPSVRRKEEDVSGAWTGPLSTSSRHAAPTLSVPQRPVARPGLTR